MNVRLIIIQFVLIACTSCSSDKTLIKGCGIPIVLNEIKDLLLLLKNYIVLFYYYFIE